jgi:glucose/arabinose dehydrogenase/plastocyanin
MLKDGLGNSLLWLEMGLGVKTWRVLLLFVVAVVPLSIVGSGTEFEVSSLLISSQRHYRVEVAFPVLLFDAPVGIYNAKDGSNRLFVVEQAGLVWAFNNSRDVFFAELFLNISDRVLFGGEQGLLGLAFHPSFRDNGFFYVDYVADNPRRTVVARFSVAAGNPDEADINSEKILLEVEQPFANHKGGQIAFGLDGYLYVALGDGGSGGDPLGNGQNRSSLLGKILRIDVDSTSDGRNYSIPVDNPFVGNMQGFREEIFAYGFRNPWRFSFDSGRLWVGDVGQDRMEEVDIVEKGKNYGWNVMEGSLCFNPSVGCNQTGLELPVWEYGHDLGIAVTGGFVYRGSRLAELVGAYIYGDYGSGRIWALRYNGGSTNEMVVDTDLLIPSFGVDEAGELYVCAFDGRIYQLVAVDDVHLYGSSVSGWGFAQDNMATPGPTITVVREDTVNLSLTGVDTAVHRFFVDYDGDGNPSAGEPASPNFQSGTVSYEFTAGVAGSFTYYCQFHRSRMFGTFIVKEGTLITDVNGDGKVDILDIFIVANAFNSKPGDTAYNPQVDLDQNGMVNILDIFKVAKDFGKAA